MTKKRRNRLATFLLSVLLLAFAVLVVRFFFNIDNTNVVNVYDWYGNLSKEILDQFEKETGIKVRYDVYDSNEILEAKLLATNSGYDVVFPSASPYVARQIQAGVYHKLDKKLLPNLKDLHSSITKQMDNVDKGMQYAIPYYWGTLGIVMDIDKVSKLIPNAQNMGYELIFNPKNLEKLAGCGVSFLEEPVDVFPLLLAYLGKDRESEDLEDLELVFNHLLKLRPYIRRFTSSRFINDLLVGDVCIVQAWSGEIQRAQELLKELGRKLVYVTPKEGTTLWIDCMTIPKGALHYKNAHAFINFLLRPDISAKVINHSSLPTTVQKSYKYVNEQIKNDPSVFPPKQIFSKLHLDKPCTSGNCQVYDRKRTRMWAHVKLAGNG